MDLLQTRPYPKHIIPIKSSYPWQRLPAAFSFLHSSSLSFSCGSIIWFGQGRKPIYSVSSSTGNVVESRRGIASPIHRDPTNAANANKIFVRLSECKIWSSIYFCLEFESLSVTRAIRHLNFLFRHRQSRGPPHAQNNDQDTGISAREQHVAEEHTAT